MLKYLECGRMVCGGMAKRILIMESDSFGRRSNRSDKMLEIYRQLKKDRGYKVCIFGKAQKGIPKTDCINRSGLYRTRFDAIILGSLKDAMYIKTYRLFNRGDSTRYIYVDNSGTVSELLSKKISRLLPSGLVRWNLFLNLSAWLDSYIAMSSEERRLAEEHFDGVGTKVHTAGGSRPLQLAMACRHAIRRS